MIKYRAWLIKEKKLVNVLCIDFENKRILYDESKFNSYWVNLDEVVLMSSVGFTDKNNPDYDIFEGDIVTICNTSYNQDVIGKIVWEAKKGMFMLKNEYYPLTTTLEGLANDLIVIGNIYESSNILK